MGVLLEKIKKKLFAFSLKRSNGFTLIELLLVIAILGILTGIAVPLFLGERSKAMHAEAKSNLESLRLVEEQYFAENGSYGACAAYPCTLTYKGTYGTSDNGIEDLLPGFKPGDVNSLKFSYTLTISNNGNSFTATATGKSGTPISGATFSIDQDNNRIGF